MKLTRVGMNAAALTGVLLLAGCSGDGDTVSAPTAPATAGVTSSATSGDAGSQTPAATAEASEPTPTETPSAIATPTPTSLALTGRFRNDVGVKTLVAYFTARAQAINAKNPNLPALVALDTAEQPPYTVKDVKEEIGGYAPPTPPFAPLSVSVQSATERSVAICLKTKGDTLDTATRKPLQHKVVEAGNARLVKVNGTWKLKVFFKATPAFSCGGVTL